MTVIGQVRKGAYYDSVTLMRVGKELAALPGVADASVVMGTRANQAILKTSGLLLPEFGKATDTDLLIAVRAKDARAAQAALNALDAQLKKATKKSAAAEEAAPATLDGALRLVPGANLAMISIAGRYAAAEAMKALERGLHVMLFSDNVSLEDEIRLKTLAVRKGLLVMGPDCGTAIINGVPLAFANVVRRGRIGVVAAAGTGLQEVTTIISNEGEGISQAIGTGGRDVKKDVGGIMFLAGLEALAADRQTEVILLVSKPPHPSVLAKIEKVVRRIRKPVVSMFIGAGGIPNTLEQAAFMAVALARGEEGGAAVVRLVSRDAHLAKEARRKAARLGKGRKYVRGLFSGGTFCAEAQILFGGLPGGLYSNAPTGTAKPLRSSLKSVRNTVVDLGEDEFTVGRPHPMIDYSLRNQRIAQEAADPETAVILLDVVLGYGSNGDPAAELAPVIRAAARKVRVVASVTGTDADPQNAPAVKTALEKAGAIVLPSNAAACRLAAEIVKAL